MKLTYLLFSYLLLFFLALLDNSRSAIYPQLLSQYKISTDSGSLIFSISSLFSLSIALCSPWWLKRYGAVYMSKIALLLLFSASVILALSKEIFPSFTTFLVGVSVMGLGVGVLSISVNLVLNSAIASDHPKRRQVFSGLHAMYGIASFIAPVALALLVTKGYGWDAYFLGLSILTGLLFVFFVRLPSRNLTSQEKKKLPLTKKQLFILTAIFSFYVSGEVLLSSRFALILEQHFSYNELRSKTYLSYFFMALLLGRVLFAVIHLRVSSLSLLKISMVLTLLFFGAGYTMDPLFLVLSGLSMSYFFPCAMDWLAGIFHVDMEQIFARVMIGVGSALVIIHWFFGQLADLAGIEYAIYIMPIFHIIVLYLLQFQTGFLKKCH